MEIKAISGNHILIRDNKPARVGTITTGQRKTIQGELTVFSEVVFDFGTEHKDIFIFENNKLAEYHLSFCAPGHISKIYSDCIRRLVMTESELIDLVVQSFVFTELGF